MRNGFNVGGAVRGGSIHIVRNGKGGGRCGEVG